MMDCTFTAKCGMQVKEVARVALDNGIRIRGSIATTFGCPFEGRVLPQKVDNVAQEYLTMGVHEICLADTAARGSMKTSKSPEENPKSTIKASGAVTDG
jgi:hypothetical protein